MQTSYNGLALPKDGSPIDYANGEYKIPDNPIIPAGTAIVIVPRALAFKNDRRLSALLVRPAKSRPP